MTSSQHLYEVRPRKDHRGVNLISDVLPFGRLWYGEPNAVSNAVGYARFYSRSAKKRNRGNGECCRPRHCAPSYHFVIAVWRLKAAQFDQREVLGSHR